MENWSQSDIMEHMFSHHQPSGSRGGHNFVRFISFDRLLIASAGVHDAILNTNLWEFIISLFGSHVVDGGTDSCAVCATLAIGRFDEIFIEMHLNFFRNLEMTKSSRELYTRDDSW